MIYVKKEFVSNPEISVIMCAYNRQDTIAQAVEGVLNQVCNVPFELIIGEDCGSDDTLKICLDFQRRYPEIIKIIQHEENCGLGKNWAILVRHAKGKYIASCDDDDYWHNVNKLQMQFDYMENHKNCGMLHTDYDILHVDRKRIETNHNKRLGKIIPEGRIQKEIFEGNAGICVSTSFSRKEFLDKYIPYEQYDKLRPNIQDWPTWIILSKYSDIDYLDISTTTYRMGHIAISNIKSFDKLYNKIAKDELLYKFICSLFPDDLKYVENEYNRYKYSIIFNYALKLVNFNEAKKNATLLLNLGESNIQIKIARYYLPFLVLAYLKRIKAKFK